MLRSMGAGIQEHGREVVRFAGDSLEWLTQTLPKSVKTSVINLIATGEKKKEDFSEWTWDGYKVGQIVIYTNEKDYRITAHISSRDMNELGEFVYTIEIHPGTYFMGDMRGYDTTADGVVSDYFREQTIKVLHTSLRKGK